MVTATADKPKRRSKPGGHVEKVPALNVLVAFSGVSIGDGTARVGVRVLREWLQINKADESLCGRRLTGRIVRLKDGEDPNQTLMLDEDRHQIAGSFDVKSFGVNQKAISFGLTFSLKDIDISELGFFAKQSGRLIVDQIVDLDVVDDDESGDPDEDRPLAEGKTTRRKKVERPADFTWRPDSVESLGLSAAIVKRLEKAGLKNIGQLCDFLKQGQPLGAVVGDANSDKVSEGVVGYLREHNIDPAVIGGDEE